MYEKEQLAEALREAMRLKGDMSQQALADEFGVRQSSVSEWRRYGRVAKRHIDHLISYFSDVVPPEHWGLSSSSSGESSPPNGPRPAQVAHAMSQSLQILSSSTLEWDKVATMNLPERFTMVVPDGAMHPHYKEGATILFSTIEGAPRPMDMVLVADHSGNAYFRRYELRTPDHFVAVAAAPGYQPLDSTNDGLRVLAIMVGSVAMGRAG